MRRALYICTWSGIRVDGDMRSSYQGLRQRGKPGKVAMVAVMGKLLFQLNAVARRGTAWVPKTAQYNPLHYPTKGLNTYMDTVQFPESTSFIPDSHPTRGTSHSQRRPPSG